MIPQGVPCLLPRGMEPEEGMWSFQCPSRSSSALGQRSSVDTGKWLSVAPLLQGSPAWPGLPVLAAQASSRVNAQGQDTSLMMFRLLHLHALTPLKVKWNLGQPTLCPLRFMIYEEGVCLTPGTGWEHNVSPLCHVFYSMLAQSNHIFPLPVLSPSPSLLPQGRCHDLHVMNT